MSEYISKYYQIENRGSNQKIILEIFLIYNYLRLQCSGGIYSVRSTPYGEYGVQIWVFIFGAFCGGNA
jgi:hypothetical protein